MPKKLTTIYVVRHGESEANVKRIIQGHSSSDLSSKGVADSKKLAKKLEGIKFDKAFSSDLLRARRTAEIIVLERKIILETTERLREQNVGHYEGLSFDKFNALFTNWRELTEKEKHAFKLSDDVESNEDAVSRLILFLREVSVAYPGKTILVVCHGSIMRYLMIHLGAATYEGFWGFENNGYLKLESDGVDFFIKDTEGFRNFEE